MEIQDVIKQNPERKTVKINLAVTQSTKDFFTKNNISPQKVLDLAVLELKKQEDK